MLLKLKGKYGCKVCRFDDQPEILQLFILIRGDPNPVPVATVSIHAEFNPVFQKNSGWLGLGYTQRPLKSGVSERSKEIG